MGFYEFLEFYFIFYFIFRLRDTLPISDYFWVGVLGFSFD